MPFPAVRILRRGAPLHGPRALGALLGPPAGAGAGALQGAILLGGGGQESVVRRRARRVDARLDAVDAEVRVAPSVKFDFGNGRLWSLVCSPSSQNARNSVA